MGIHCQVTDGGGLKASTYIKIDILDENDNIPHCESPNLVTAPLHFSRGQQSHGIVTSIVNLNEFCHDNDNCGDRCGLKYRFMEEQECPYGKSAYNWPASREKGPSDIANSVDQDQPLYVVEIIYT